MPRILVAEEFAWRCQIAWDGVEGEGLGARIGRFANDEDRARYAYMLGFLTGSEVTFVAGLGLEPAEVHAFLDHVADRMSFDVEVEGLFRREGGAE
jgi:hypothetical protein